MEMEKPWCGRGYITIEGLSTVLNCEVNSVKQLAFCFVA